MPIIRVQHRKHGYAIMQTSCLEDSRLSWRARGMLAYLLSRPDQWEVRLADLVHRSHNEKIGAIRNALKELTACGYARMETLRGEHGRLLGKGYIISEEIFTDMQKIPTSVKPDVGDSRRSVLPTFGKSAPIVIPDRRVIPDRKEDPDNSHKNESYPGAGNGDASPPGPAVRAHTKTAMPLREEDWPGLKQLLTDFGFPVSSLNDNEWWNDLSYTCNNPDNAWLTREFAKMHAWLTENPRRRPTTSWKRFVRGWLERAYDQERRKAYATKESIRERS